MNKRSIVLFIIALAPLAGACSDREQVKESIAAMAPLVPIEGCDALLASLKAREIASMEEQVDRNMDAVLDGDYCYYGGYAEDAANGVPGPSSGSTRGGDGSKASEYSTTNNQVAGVDEADFIKNDGGYIYILAGGAFKIIDAWPAPESRIISTYPVEGEPQKLFVLDGRAVIYSALSAAGESSGRDGYYGGECTYGYDCDFTGDGRPMKITVLDIADLTAPRLLRETVFSGSYINSRRIDRAVYTVVTYPEIVFPGVSYWPEDYAYRCTSFPLFERHAIRRAFNALKERNRDLINATVLSDWLPSVRDTTWEGDTGTVREGLLDSCEGFYESGLTDGRSMLTIVSFDLSRGDPLGLVSIVGRPGAVYASDGALYVASRHYSSWGGWYYDGAGSVEEVTTIHKFRLDGAAATASYAASGVAKGRVLNQFSMDEHEGFLRIATSTGHLPDPDTHSTMSVLEQRGTDLAVVGVVDNIAPSEDIRSVRFNGARGFIVTFKKTDPLFVFDLFDPRNPHIDGELHIPGYSTYMHVMDDTHLLTIGYDADEMGDFAWFQGIQLQVFDVSKLSDPRLLAKEVIGTRGSTSDAATNHLAFNFFKPRDLLAIPMTICEGGDGGTYGDRMTFSGLMVYRVTVAGGFEARGRVSHLDPAAPDPGASCGNWWTNSNSQVKRSIFMDDYVYSVALDKIKIDHLDSLGTDVAVVDID